jgi:hypothetical protein
MLATVGQCVLARRLVADLACWSSRAQGLRTSRVASTSPLAVSLLVPGPRSARPVSSAARHGMTTIAGELLPLTDPKPQVLAVGLTAAAAARLELALRHQIHPKHRRQRSRTPTQP